MYSVTIYVKKKLLDHIVAVTLNLKNKPIYGQFLNEIKNKG